MAHTEARPVVHWEIGGRDLTTLGAFYQQAFGWAIEDAGPHYRTVRAADGGLGGGLMHAHDQMPPYVTIYVQVDDLSAMLRTIGELGGTTLVPPTPINDQASFALFTDPEGNVIGLLQAAGPIR
ncbi:VOC family protein [Spirilliplanes yamanashiensis]|uniref:Glyoxalase n=1 Tax=Spirilliplanes yamanashiensis TaxID=42233 RepID=A0A8J3YEM9_9ACTN|nr:VOC family protein [Spirilliplanes yamanashiensis]MDP9818326.1 putative enzyme related to lactoylglutathione lyase [Spirilliplanes yamanashiensis]GIJ06545.1 glyoxalase [Spirilliplanes yamanashiensis]